MASTLGFCCVCGAARARRGSGMDGREGGSRGTDTPAETCLGLSTCGLSSQVIANGPISANLAVADPMVTIATARCVGNGVKTMSTNTTYRRVVRSVERA